MAKRVEKMIGREREMAELQRSMESDRSEFIIVYGRRRVGKTYLVDHFFNRNYDFSFVGGHRLSKTKQLRNFGKSLKRHAHMQRQPKFSEWDDAFDALEEYLDSISDNRKKVIFFDEMPWIDTPQSEFVDALEMFGTDGQPDARTSCLWLAAHQLHGWWTKLWKTKVVCTGG